MYAIYVDKKLMHFGDDPKDELTIPSILAKIALEHNGSDVRLVKKDILVAELVDSTMLERLYLEIYMEDRKAANSPYIPDIKDNSLNLSMILTALTMVDRVYVTVEDILPKETLKKYKLWYNITYQLLVMATAEELLQLRTATLKEVFQWQLILSNAIK